MKRLVRITCMALGLAALFAANPAGAAGTGTTLREGLFTIEIEDHAQRFLAWLDAAREAPDADARWILWQQLYGEAAVPPTPQGRELARRLVDAAWPRYDEAVPAAKAGAERVAQPTARTLNEVARLLQLDRESRVGLKTIIGGFEKNAYAYRADVPVLVLPLETIDPDGLTIAHEGTHVVHMLLSGQPGQWERSLAAIAIQEGLAMHVACELNPGRSDEDCVGGSSGYWAQAAGRKEAILRGAKDELSRSDPATAAKYTYGNGNTGLRREGYAIGWWVVAQLRHDGMSLAQIARIDTAAMPDAAGHAIAELLAAK